MLALTLLTGCNDDKLKTLEAENQQMKARLRILETEHPSIDVAKLEAFGKDQLGTSIPDDDTPGFQRARASLAGVNAVRGALEKVSPLTTKAEIEQQLLNPLHALQDMWPAYISPANQQIDPMFQSCRDLPIVLRIGIEAGAVGNKTVLNLTSDLEKHIRFECALALSAATIKSKHKQEGKQ
ncbi:hypothetical protein [Aquitalea pelogenes]|uniref:hypothetical protein n=1 Tax=Aquitalea pelogenes TaxID=1293573 RepID=UPI00128F14B3|nr:hypothetical protein [Aquitalea pelogenes]